MQFITLYILRFLAFFGLYIFMPFYAIWLLRNDILPAVQVAYVVAILIATNRLSSLFLAGFVKRYEKRKLIFAALATAITSFVLMTISYGLKFHYFFLWCLLSLLLGASMSAITLCLLTFVAMAMEKGKQLAGYSYLNIAVNLSAGIGPLIGGFTLFYAHHYLPLVPIPFLLLAMILVLYLPKTTIDKVPSHSWHELKKIDKRFFYFLLINFLTLIAYALFYDVFPLFAQNTIGERWTGTLFLLSGIIIALSQIPMTHFFNSKKINVSISVAALLLAFGLLFMLGAHYNLLILCIIGISLFSLAEVIYVPLYRTLAVQLYSTEHKVIPLAILSFTWGIAESVTAWVGIYLVTKGLGGYFYLFGIVAMFAIILVLFTTKIFKNAHLDHHL